MTDDAWDASVERPDGSWVTERRRPLCGRDFCDQCGDCLACFGDDPCPGPYGVHTFVVYCKEGA